MSATAAAMSVQNWQIPATVLIRFSWCELKVTIPFADCILLDKIPMVNNQK
jgi:hypothetical protein